jgi:hypothetical protein
MPERELPKENMEIPRGFNARNRRRFDPLMSITDEEVKSHLIVGFADPMGRSSARDSVSQLWPDRLGTTGGNVELDSVLDAGESSYATAAIEGAGETRSVPVKDRVRSGVKPSRGKVSRVDSYYEASGALKAIKPRG